MSAVRLPARLGRRRRAGRAAQAGFTMIEVMVSVLLTAIATSGIVGLYMVETRASGFSRHTTEATVLAEDTIEQLRARSLPDAGPSVAVNEHGIETPDGLFLRIYSVVPSTVAAMPYDELKVEIIWTEDGVSRRVMLQARRNQ